jgi:hypothetical protein
MNKVKTEVLDQAVFGLEVVYKHDQARRVGGWVLVDVTVWKKIAVVKIG